MVAMGIMPPPQLTSLLVVWGLRGEAGGPTEGRSSCGLPAQLPGLGLWDDASATYWHRATVGAHSPRCRGAKGREARCSRGSTVSGRGHLWLVGTACSGRSAGPGGRDQGVLQLKCTYGKHLLFRPGFKLIATSDHATVGQSLTLLVCSLTCPSEMALPPPGTAQGLLLSLALGVSEIDFLMHTLHFNLGLQAQMLPFLLLLLLLIPTRLSFMNSLIRTLILFLG